MTTCRGGINPEGNSFRMFLLLSLVVHAGAVAGISMRHSGAVAIPAAMEVDLRLTDMTPPEPGEKRVGKAAVPRPQTAPVQAEPAPRQPPQSALQAVAQSPAVTGQTADSSAETKAAAVPQTAAAVQITGRPFRPPAPVPVAVTPPAPPVGVTGHPPASASRKEYLAVIRAMIDRHKVYPVMARKGGLEGTVFIRFTVARDGSLKQADISRSSGSAILDRAAALAVTVVERFPPLPDSLYGAEVSLEVPVTYKLGGS